MIASGFRASRLINAGSLPLYALVGFVTLTFMLGGGARGDITSLLILRPLAALTAAAALFSLSRDHVLAHRYLFAMAGAVIGLAVLHLVPLPPALWTALPGRDVVVAVERAAGLQSGWRPLTLSPAGGWNALFSLMVPMAVLLLAVQNKRDDRRRWLLPMVVIGTFSAFLSLGQLLQGSSGSLYFYDITNSDSPVGLFANRNHHAVFLACILPMLGVLALPHRALNDAGQPTPFGRQMVSPLFRLWMAILIGAFIIPLILVIGSRAGLLTGVLGLAAAAWLYHSGGLSVRTADKGKTARWTWVAFGAGVAVLGTLTLVMARGLAFTRLLSPTDSDQQRQDFWPVVYDATVQYLPFGSGSGSFVRAFQIHEPHAMLVPTYVNHAHNDWLEVAMTFGLPGILLLAVAVFAGARVGYAAIRDKSASTRTQTFRRLGVVIMSLLAIGSVGDYPLRTPALSALFVLATLWATLPAREEKVPARQSAY